MEVTAGQQRCYKWTMSCMEKPLGSDFPSGPVVKNPPANAEDMGSNPGPGGSHVPHVGQLSPCTATAEFVL